MKQWIDCLLLASLVTACGREEAYDASGTFEATEVVVSAEASGRILSFAVEEGNRVEAAVAVGVIDTVQLALQRQQIERQAASSRSNRPDIARQIAALREQIAWQERERQRVGNLLQDGAATVKQRDDIEAQLRILNGQLEALRSTLHKNTRSIDEGASALELQMAQIDDRLARCRIVSPVAGTVLAKYAEAGEVTAAGRPLMKVADLERIFLRAYLTSEQLAGVALGQAVTVVADFGGDEQYEYAGRVTWIASESEFTPRNIQTRSSRANLVYAVKIAVQNDGRLKLGLYGHVKL